MAAFTEADDAPHKNTGKESYEWWYFDALFDDTGTPLPAMNAFQRSD